jgi:uncharacterized protein YuzE
MNVRYDREEDILVIKMADEPIDYAEEIGSVIVHFTKDGKAVLFEILDAAEFLANEAPNHLIELERARLTLVANPELTATTI